VVEPERWQGDLGAGPIADTSLLYAQLSANDMRSHMNRPRGVRLAYICDITYGGWLTVEACETWELQRQTGGVVVSRSREDQDSKGAVDGLNSFNTILLVCSTGDETCIHTP
jgi:hypothetical protein